MTATGSCLRTPRAGALLVCLLLACACSAPNRADEVDRTKRGPFHRVSSAERNLFEALSINGLAPEKIVFEDAIGGDVTLHFAMDLEAGDAFVATIEQDGIDLEATIIAPETAALDREPWPRIDSPTGTTGTELICFVAPVSGRYGLDLHSFHGEPGRMRLEVDPVRPASPEDRACEQALAALDDGLALAATEQRQEALLHLREAQDGFARAGRPSHQLLATIHGCRQSAAVEAVSEAASCFAQARHLADALADIPEAISARFQEGLLRMDMSELAAAERLFAEAHDLAEKTGSNGSVVDGMINLALLEQRRGRLHRALDRVESALELARQSEDQRRVRSSLIHLGWILTQLGRLEEGRDHFVAAQTIAADSSSETALLLESFGWNRVLAGETEEALDYLEAAVEGFSRANDPPALQRTFRWLGTARLAAGDCAGSRTAYRHVALLASARGDREALLGLHAHLAWSWIECGEPATALALIMPVSAALVARGDTDVAYYAWMIRARALHDLGELGQARLAYRHAFAIIDALRDEGLGAGRFADPVPLWQDYHEHFIELLLALAAKGDDAARAEAFLVADAVRVRNFNTMLQQSRIDLQAGVDPELVAREQALRDKIDHVRALHEFSAPEAAAASDAEDSERALRTLLGSLRSARAAILRQHPRFAEIIRPQPLTIAALRDELGPSAQLLRFVLGERRSVVFVLDRDNLRSWTLPARAKLESLATPVITNLRSSDQRRARAPARHSVARLTAALLADVLPALDAERVFVVADGALAYVPFGALPIGDGSDELLIDRYEVRYLPSAASLVNLRRRARNRTEPRRELAVIGDPVFSPDDARLARKAASVADRWPRLHLLPAARAEAEAISNMLAEDQRHLLLGFDATVENLDLTDLAQYRLVHFVSHALIDDRHPEVSAIVLTGFDPSGTKLERNELPLHRIWGLHLNADVVVLSGCRTAIGPQIRGEGLVNLARGFFYAGASSLVVSLWEVSDPATAALMTRFYQAMLVAGESPATALRTAQLWVRAQPGWSAPYYWAPFVIVGDPGSGT